ncbi:MAG: beta-ketoacyl-[acyl-carrier-protein] synthase family protein [Planctomycetota bacterium]
MKRRVVVTGLGALCALGTTCEEIWERLSAGESGIRPIARLDVGDFPSKLAGEIPEFDAKKYVAQRKSLKVMARDIQLAVAAAEMAVRDAGLDKCIDRTRIGCSMGAGLIPSEVDELGPSMNKSIEEDQTFQMKKWGMEVMSNLFPLWLLKYLPNMLACHISIFHDAQGPNNTLLTGDAAGLQAIGEAFGIIQRGAADVFLAGAADCRVHPLSLLRFELIHQLTHRNEEGPLAVKPFDAERDGFVAAEGAAVLILEEIEHARARGAKIYAEVKGFGWAHQAIHPAALEVSAQGITTALRSGIRDAGLGPNKVSCVFAHAEGARKGDAAEAQAIREVFGDSDVPVTASKGLIGQTCAASGALDAAFCVQALMHDVIPPTPSFRKADPDCPVRVARETRRTAGLAHGLVSAVSTGGQCASLVLGKWL